MFKKKYHGGLKVFLLLLFGMLFVIPSTSYASTNVTREYLEWSFDYLYNNGSFGSYDTRFKTALYSFKSNAQNISNVLNQLSTLQSTFNVEELGNYNLTIHTDVWSGANNIWFTFFNASSPGSTNIAHLSIKSPNTVQPKTNATTIGGKLYHMKMTLTNAGVPSFSQLEEVTSAGTYGSFGSMTWNSELTVLTVQNMTFAGVPFGYAYYPVNGSSPYPAIFQSIGGNFIVEELDPEEPSGDIISSSTGTITNSSGDVTGSIDLSGITSGIKDVQNQISGDTTRIIENQNQNTEQIVTAINNSNENYWGPSGDLDGDSQISDIEDNFNNIISSTSGELSNNKVILSLESAESGFLDLFKNPHEETWYDLSFEWNDIYLYDTKLISTGSINISQMCRDITVLGYIQGIIRALFNFGVAITLIKQIYNLILSTLGIDNPYLFEDGAETTLVNMETGEYRQFYKRRRRRL